MAASSRRARFLAALGALFVAACAVALVAAYAVDRALARFLKLPEDSVLVELGAPELADELIADAEAGAAEGIGGHPMGGQEPPEEAEEPETTDDSGPPSLDDYDVILEWNIFDSTKVGKPVESTGSDGSTDRRTDLRVTLYGTVVAEPPEYSSALIADEGSRTKPLGYGIGDKLLGEAEIVRIEQKRVVIRRSDGTEEYIGMDEGDMEARKAGGDAPAAAAEGVASLGENKFQIEQSLIDQALQNPESMASMARVVPHKDPNGDVDGYRLSGIRRNSLPSKLGIKNGDIVHAVNGKQIRGPTDALDMMNTLQNERSFSVELTRRNQKQTFEYEVR